jgi:hypothetical protein
MLSSDVAEEAFRDTENGDGLLMYTPLRYEAPLEFDSYYPAHGLHSLHSTWLPPLPRREDARHVTFEFTTRSGNGTVATFSTQSFPLVYDEVVISRTPAPENKCRREQGGTWRDRHCHVVMRLTSVCLQVQLGADGAWHPHPRVPPQDAAGSAQLHGSSTVTYGDTYGCDPRNKWSPVTYTLDSCWGPRHPSSQTHGCPRDTQTPAHHVGVVVRSSADPWLRAEELTDDKFDFGLSQASQRAYGITMLVVGSCLGMIPLMRLCIHCYSPEDDDDRRSLRYRADEEADCCATRGDFSGGPYPHNGEAGVYGRRTMSVVGCET